LSKHSVLSRWSLRALPLVGAALGPFVVSGTVSWLAKSVAGLCFGGAVSLVAWHGQHVSPVSTALALLAAVLLAVGVLVVPVLTGIASLPLLAVVALAAALVFWGLVRL
jgi:hypothetical protein